MAVFANVLGMSIVFTYIARVKDGLVLVRSTTIHSTCENLRRLLASRSYTWRLGFLFEFRLLLHELACVPRAQRLNDVLLHLQVASMDQTGANGDMESLKQQVG